MGQRTDTDTWFLLVYHLYMYMHQVLFKMMKKFAARLSDIGAALAAPSPVLPFLVSTIFFYACESEQPYMCAFITQIQVYQLVS